MSHSSRKAVITAIISNALVTILKFIAGSASTRAFVELIITRTKAIIDEIEAEICKRIPRVSHITLEIEGIVQQDHSAIPAT